MRFRHWLKRRLLKFVLQTRYEGCLGYQCVSKRIYKPQWPPGCIVELMRSGLITACMTEHLWDELNRLIAHEKIRKYLSKQHGIGYVDALMAPLHGSLLFFQKEPPLRNWVPRDEDDNWVIQCALTANTAYIISGDQDLTALGGSVEGIPIVTPAEFLNVFQGPKI